MKIKKHLRNSLIPHRRNGYKPYLIRHSGLTLVAAVMIGAQAIFNYQTTGSFQVLGYATNINVSDLLSLTNSNRNSNGLSSLSINSQLNTAAQQKAQHMIDNDYWAHTSPDGVTPWYWIDITGYAYDKAGENLAYGFATSAGTVDGWMNSPGHRANILDGSYKQVGFGIANGSNYQGGENTVVVAMYAQPKAAAPQTNSTPAEPTPSPTPAPTAAESPAPPTPISETDETESATDVAMDETTEDLTLSQRALLLARPDAPLAVTNAPDDLGSVQGRSVSTFEALITGQAGWSYYVSIGALLLLSGVYMLRHMTAVYQLVRHGEHYILGHPLLEASLIYIAVWVVLASSWGAVL